MICFVTILGAGAGYSIQGTCAVLICRTESPLASFEWNTDLIYQELSGPPNNWSPTTIHWNVIKRLESSEVNASAYDGDSIMLYQYPPRWFKNSGGVGTKDNTALSKRDKEWIATNYPPWSSDIGQFSTLRKWKGLYAGWGLRGRRRTVILTIIAGQNSVLGTTSALTPTPRTWRFSRRMRNHPVSRWVSAGWTWTTRVTFRS